VLLRKCAPLVVAAVMVSCGGGNGSDVPVGAVDADRAATVSIRALAQAGMLDRNRRYLLYEGIKEIDGGWEVTLSAGNFTLVIERSEGRLIVAEAEGFADFPDEERSILGYSEPAEPEPPGHEFYDLALTAQSDIKDRPDGPIFEASFFWRGPIPSKLQSTCRVEIVDENDELVHQGEEFVLDAPQIESSRGGGLHVERIPEQALDGSAEVTCEVA
jgi:hypothetical protein